MHTRNSFTPNFVPNCQHSHPIQTLEDVSCTVIKIYCGKVTVKSDFCLFSNGKENEKRKHAKGKYDKVFSNIFGEFSGI